jgi:hypothetical protein
MLSNIHKWRCFLWRQNNPEVNYSPLGSPGGNVSRGSIAQQTKVITRIVIIIIIIIFIIIVIIIIINFYWVIVLQRVALIRTLRRRKSLLDFSVRKCVTDGNI